MARQPRLHSGQVEDEETQRNLKSLREYVKNLERRVRKLEATKHLPLMAEIALSADLSNPVVAEHVEFDVAVGPLIDSGVVRLSKGTGQELGLITLRGGVRYLIEGTVSAALPDASGAARLEWFVDGAQLAEADNGARPKRMLIQGNEVASNAGSEPHSAFLYTPSTEVELKLEIDGLAGTITTIEEGTRILITQVAT